MSKQSLSLLLPSAFPDLSYIARCLSSNRVIIHDTLPFSRKSRVHRGKIRTPQGVQWIYLPVHQADRNLPLHMARLESDYDWLTPLWRAIEYNYRNSIFFEHYEPEIRADFEHVQSLELYTDAIRYLNSKYWKYLQIDNDLPEIEWWSDIRKTGKDTAKLTDGEQVESSDFIANFSKAGMVYQEKQSRNFHQPARNMVSFNDKTIAYRQHFGGFEEDCCILDIIFEEGPDAWKVIEMLT